MTPEQENELFKSLGAIQAAQASILSEVRTLKADIKDDLKAINDRQDKFEAQTNARIEKVETHTQNLRIKLAAAGGSGGLAALLIAELLKRGGL